MKDSHVFQGFNLGYDDVDNNNDHEFDFQIDFKQFLEEAKRFANEKKLHPVAKEQNKDKKQAIHQETKGMKKSWKATFLSFWRSSKKKANQQHSNETSRSFHNTDRPNRRCCFSGPVYDMEAAAATSRRKWRRASMSGTLTSALHLKNEIPYVSLDRFKEAPQYDVNKTYGPVYLVS